MIEPFKNMGYPELQTLAPSEGKGRPFWSVVVPVHNRTQYLQQCLESVTSQLTNDYELLVVDTTDSPLSLLSTPVHFPRAWFSHFGDLGPINNWNRAISLTRGRWIHLLNDDDWVKPGFYLQLRQGLESAASQGYLIGIASTGYENERAGSITFRNHLTEQPGVLPPEEWLPKIGMCNPLNTPAVVIARDTYEQVGLYSPDLAYCADWELYRRAACVTGWWSEPNYLARWRLHGEQGTHLVSRAAKYASLLATARLGQQYFPKEMADSVSLKARQHWYGQACLEAAALRAAGDGTQADGVLEAASVLW